MLAEPGMASLTSRRPSELRETPFLRPPVVQVWAVYRTSTFWLMGHSLWSGVPCEEKPVRALGARRYLSDRLFPKRTEARAQLLGKKLRLFPGSEMTALLHLVVVDEIGIGPLRPVPRRLVKFVREDAHGSWDLDALGIEKGELVLPIKAS